MGSVTEARRVGLAVLREVHRGGRLDRVFDEEASSLPSGDRAWVQELTYGVHRFRGRIDHLLDAHLDRGIQGVSSLLLDLLRTGTYQLLHMDSVPSYAAVSQSVDHAREVAGEGSSGLVNAVLRSVAEAGEDPSLFPDFQEDPAGWLSSWGSHPRWLVDRWLRRWSPEEVRRLVERNNRIPSIHLRPLGMSQEEALERLGARGLKAEPVGEGTGCLRLAPGSDPRGALEAVPGVIQDPAAALVPVYAEVPREGTAADLCAAPGGKALVLASRCAYLLAGDRSPRRLRLLKENVERVGGILAGEGPPGGRPTGESGVEMRLGIVAARAEAPPLREVDAVLLDVPCTGTGTLARHPDLRWRLQPDDLPKLVEVQRRILEGGAGVVAPGGILVYSTCSLEPEENDEQVAWFLETHPRFESEPPETAPEGFVDEGGRLRVLPQDDDGFDGAFAARLRRKR